MIKQDTNNDDAVIDRDENTDGARPMCYSFSQTAPCNSVAPKCKVTICPQVDGSARTINALVLHTDTACHDEFVSVLSCIPMPHSLKSSCFLFFGLFLSLHNDLNVSPFSLQSF